MASDAAIGSFKNASNTLSGCSGSILASFAWQASRYNPFKSVTIFWSAASSNGISLSKVPFRPAVPPAASGNAPTIALQRVLILFISASYSVFAVLIFARFSPGAFTAAIRFCFFSISFPKTRLPFSRYVKRASPAGKSPISAICFIIATIF